MKFSIIIPVYNVEQYLENCINSVLKQSFEDYEVILINDGSTDESSKICDDFKNKDERIKVFHQRNKGQSAARNSGVLSAHGEYILFLDSDDEWNEAGLLKKIMDVVDGNDLVVFDWKEVPDGRNKDDFASTGIVNKLKDKYDSGIDYLSEALEGRALYPWYSWFYAVKRTFWLSNGFEFLEGKKYEDVALTYKMLLAAKRVAVLKYVGYIYRIQRQGSTTYGVNYNAECDKLNAAVNNIKDVLNQTHISKELKLKLCNNFSCLYYSVLIQSYRIADPQKRKSLWGELEKQKWICKYTTSRGQLFAKYSIQLLGIPFTSKLLDIRRVLKHGK